MPCHRIVVFSFVALLAAAAGDGLPAQTTRFFTFNDGYQPHWTQGDVQLINCSGAPEYYLFQVANGVLQQRTSPTPMCNAFFCGGSLPGVVPTTGAGLDRWRPTFLEARLAVVGGMVPAGGGGIPILWMHTIGRSALRVDLSAGAVGIEHAGGVVWSQPAGGIAGMHVYRVEMQPNAGAPMVRLLVDGVPTLGPLPATLDWIYDGWAFGDGSPGNADAVDVDWDYFAVVQDPPGIGMANSADAMLLVEAAPPYFPNGSSGAGAPGLAGPLRVRGLAGQSLHLQWNGPANVPFALLLAPSLGLPRPFGCGGTLDIGTAPGFADVSIAFDPTLPVFGSLFTLSGSGYSQQLLGVPPIAPGLLLGAIQGVVFAPSGCGYRLTTAFELRS